MAESSTHLLIPFAAGGSEACRAAIGRLALPNLERLLARMRRVGSDTGDEGSYSPPHERALAQALGLPIAGDGRIPWAAWQHGVRDGTPCAFVTPCHWQIGMDHATMTDPAALQLSADESRALLAAMRPYFGDDGIALEFETPQRWFACGEPLRGLATASLDRVIGRQLNDWLPHDAPAGRALRRLQSEMQMLLHDHPVNEERARRGLPPVNSFWISGAGALPPDAPPSQQQPHDAPTVPMALRGPALREDWVAWSDSWRAIDIAHCAALLGVLARGGAARLTLCGDRGAAAFEPAQRTLSNRLSAVFAPRAAATAVRTTLLAL